MSLALATIQRMSGAGAIIQFTAKLFKISGSSVQPITASIITGVFQLFGSVGALVLIDKMGRRKLLLISSTVVTACLFILAIYFYYLNKGKFILRTQYAAERFQSTKKTQFFKIENSLNLKYSLFQFYCGNN